MPESTSGDKYYYTRGFIRLLAKMDETALRAIKTVAIQREQSIMVVVKEALEEFLQDPKAFPQDFGSMTNGSSLKTFIPKNLHKQVKIVATRDFGKRLGDLTGFVLSNWAKARTSETKPTAPEVLPEKEAVPTQS